LERAAVTLETKRIKGPILDVYDDNDDDDNNNMRYCKCDQIQIFRYPPKGEIENSSHFCYLK